MGFVSYLGNKAKEMVTHKWDQRKRLYNIAHDISNGDWGREGVAGELAGAVKLPFSGNRDLGDLWREGDKLYDKYKDVGAGDFGLGGFGFGGDEDAYAKKAAGYDAIRSETDRMQKQRRADMDFAFGKQTEANEPSKRAYMAVYGDPETWKL